jgi:hypothetical protein
MFRLTGGSGEILRLDAGELLGDGHDGSIPTVAA